MKGGLKEAVLEKCRKLAEEGMEEEILDVAILSAKARGLLHKVGKGNDPENPVEHPYNTDQASTSSHILTVREEVREGRNTDQASTSSRIQFAIEPVREGHNTDHASTEHILTVGKGNDPKDPVELPHNTDQGSTSSPIPTEIEVVGNNAVSGNNAVGHNATVGTYAVIGNNAVIGDNGIRLRRPNDSLTDQTEFVPVEERKKKKEKPIPGERSRKKRSREKYRQEAIQKEAIRREIQESRIE